MKRSAFRWAASAIVLWTLAVSGQASDNRASLFASRTEGAFLGVHLGGVAGSSEGGARVLHVVDGSPAGEAGLRDGDVVVRFDGHEIDGPTELTRRIHGSEPGDRVELTVLRDGKKRTIEVELAERTGMGLIRRSDGEWEAWGEDMRQRLEQLGRRHGSGRDLLEHRAPYSLFSSKPRLGVQLVETTPELREHLGGDRDSGVLVSKVIVGMPAARAGVRVGDLIVSVDGRPITGVEALVHEIGQREGETFPIGLIRDGRGTEIEVSLPDPVADRPTGPRARLGRAAHPPRAPLAAPAPPALRDLPAPAPPSPPGLAV